MVQITEPEEEPQSPAEDTPPSIGLQAPVEDKKDQAEASSVPEKEENQLGKSKPCGAEDDGVESFEDALTQEQLHEKALKQANDAKEEGNKHFRAGQYEDALSRYELALQIVSDVPSSDEIRAMCHGNRAVCFFKMDKYKETINECTKSLEFNPSYLKAIFKRGEAHEKLENYDEAIADMKKIMELDPKNDQAKRSMTRLESVAAEKREKMKEEMVGKLKEMGNSLLGRFGMSLDNFKAVQDPNTGSYSVSFQR